MLAETLPVIPERDHEVERLSEPPEQLLVAIREVTDRVVVRLSQRVAVDARRAALDGRQQGVVRGRLHVDITRAIGLGRGVGRVRLHEVDEQELLVAERRPVDEVERGLRPRIRLVAHQPEVPKFDFRTPAERGDGRAVASDALPERVQVSLRAVGPVFGDERLPVEDVGLEAPHPRGEFERLEASIEAERRRDVDVGGVGASGVAGVGQRLRERRLGTVERRLLGVDAELAGVASREQGGVRWYGPVRGRPGALEAQSGQPVERPIERVFAEGVEYDDGD